MRPMCTAALSMLLLLALTACAFCADNLVYNGDFELASAEGPPAGWAAWGGPQGAVADNYARDTTNPHGGKACFRIHHPAGTKGYAVLSPEHALRPRRGMMYTITFWARADSPGLSRFVIEAYATLDPNVEAPSPGAFPITVGEGWQRFEFTLDEGWDFFADRSRYLLLGFYATRERDVARTLWIDDVRADEQPSPRQGRLIDEHALPYAPLQHRLQPGDILDIRVDARRTLRRATRDAGGVSFHRLAGTRGQPYSKAGEYTLAPQLEEAIRELRLPMTRFYAVGDEPFSVEESIDKAAAVCRRVGVPLDHVVLELETQTASTSLPPEVWARAVRHSMDKGYGFRYWEIANEPWTRGATAFPNPEAYLTHFLAVSRAIRAVQPEAQIGLPIGPDTQAWGGTLLKQCAGHYDFVVGHYYSWSDRIQDRAFEVPVLAANYQTLDLILRTNALVRAYNPGRDVYQYDTEWGLSWSGSHGEEADTLYRNANIQGTLHRAVRLIYYAREDTLRGAGGWEMFSKLDSQGYGILFHQAPEKRSLLYWLYYYFNRHVGEWVLDMQGTAPYYTLAAEADLSAGPVTPALVTLSADRKSLYMVIANGSWEQAVPLRLEMRNFHPARATGVLLTSSNLDGPPLLERKEDAISQFPVTLSGSHLTGTVPPHSVVFITIDHK